ncbi:MAG: hypothetical protein NC094_02705 [Bacteroidales bacterium]|nr:hypothetical protein [Lachnoclostridium sp.]MCM1383460.1 hypothetical protein [Lachnoclostridium sp.]MCM1464309.1 hypothetical protein [Bacteroidales bacterium]
MTTKKDNKRAVTIVAGILLAVGILWVAGVLLLLQYKQNSRKKPDEAAMKKAAAEALEMKFGEKFLVHKVYIENRREFWVVCSPESNKEVVFEAEIIGYEESQVSYSSYNYGASVVAWKISRRLEEELQQYFPECYVHTIIFNRDLDKSADSRLNITVEEYMEKPENISDGISNVRCLVQIHVNEEILWQGMTEESYRYFAEELQKDVTENKIPAAIIWVYGMDEKKLEWCRDYFQENYQGGSDYYDMLEGCSRFRMGYPGREFNLTYEEYRKAGEGD